MDFFVINLNKKALAQQVPLFVRLMESGRVELPSALAPNLPVIHRFIRFDPHGGNCYLSLAMGDALIKS